MHRLTTPAQLYIRPSLHFDSASTLTALYYYIGNMYLCVCLCLHLCLSRFLPLAFFLCACSESATCRFSPLRKARILATGFISAASAVMGLFRVSDGFIKFTW